MRMIPPDIHHKVRTDRREGKADSDERLYPIVSLDCFELLICRRFRFYFSSLASSPQCLLGHGAQAFFRDEFARNATNAISLIVNAHQRRLQALDKLQLTGCHIGHFLLALHGRAFFKRLVGRRCIDYVVATAVHQAVHQLVILPRC